MEHSLKLIAVCLSTIHDEDRYNFVKSLNKYAVAGGYRLLIFNACTDLFEQDNSHYTGEGAVFSLIPFKKLSALVLMSNFIYDKSVVNSIIERCKENHVPVISVDKELEGCINMSFTYSDTFERLCRHVIEVHGVRKPFMIAGVKGNEFSEDRVAAFRRSLESNGIEFDENDVGYGDFWENPTIDLLNRWFVTEHRSIPKAIICANDSMAVVASTYIQRLGFNVPEDCIITGFDGIMQADYHLPHLTTCRQNYDEMGRRITDAVRRLENGEKCYDGTVDFDIRFSQSCGCEKMVKRNVNESVRAVLDRFKQSMFRQELMCDIQASLSKITDLTELPQVLMDKFQFSTCVFALNSDVLEPPEFGMIHSGSLPFTDKINILCQRYHWVEQAPCTIGLSDLLPDYDSLYKRPEPIIICCLHFIGMVLGYCAFQPRIDIDDYEKMHTLMNAFDSAFGTFHGRMRIEYVNKQLLAANEELRKASQHDFMTGLYNRRGFYTETEKFHLSEKIPKDPQIALFFADLDGLKHINDTYGHSEGDNAIITMARALLSSAVRGEVCARFGGDEFCVAALVSKNCAEKFHREFKRNFNDYLSYYNENSGKPYTVEASSGFFMRPLRSALDIDELLETADKLMYEEKLAHRNARKNRS